MSDAHTLAAEIERCARRLEDARATYALASHHLRQLPETADQTAQRELADIARHEELRPLVAVEVSR